MTLQETKTERAARTYRNAGVLGAIAFAAASEIIPVAGAFVGLGIAAAAGGELVRQVAKNSRTKKKSKS